MRGVALASLFFGLLHLYPPPYVLVTGIMGAAATLDAKLQQATDGAGTAALHIDLERCGAVLPVMPKA